LRAAVRHQEDGSTARVIARIEFGYGREQRPPDIRTRKARARAAGCYPGLHDFTVLCEWNDGQRATTEEHERESVFRALGDEVRQQLACGFALLRATIPGLLGSDDRVDGAPVARQHPLVHAAATIYEHNDFRASAGSDNLRLRVPGAGET
jgi:hypothetical protein